MHEYDYLIIGGGICGTTAAEIIRSKDEKATIAILESEPYVLYSKVQIPKYIRGEISRESIFLRKISQYESARIDLYSGMEIASVDFEKHAAAAKNGKVFNYKKLLIASGGRPKELSKLFSASGELAPIRMQTLDDADNIIKTISGGGIKEVLVVGEGFIALELAEIFSLKNIKVNLLVKGNYFGEARFGDSGGKLIEEHLINNKIILHKNAEISFINGTEAQLKNGEKIKADALVLGIGISRNLRPFAGLKINEGIVTDEYFATSDKNVYAAGDVAEYYDVLAGRQRVLGSWTNAFLQGRSAALNMLSANGLEKDIKPEKFARIPSYNLKTFGYKLTYLGDLENYDNIWEKFSEGDAFASPQLARIFSRGGIITGGVLINRFNDKVFLSTLIEKKSKIEEVIEFINGS